MAVAVARQRLRFGDAGFLAQAGQRVIFAEDGDDRPVFAGFTHHRSGDAGDVSLRQADADVLPFADESFDYVLSWNVIFHGTMVDVGRRLGEVWRILRAGGLYQGTMLSKRDAQFGRGRRTAPDTFIRGTEAKAHPHYDCDLASLATLFAGFEVLSVS